MTTVVERNGNKFKVTDHQKVSDKPVTEKHKGKAFDSLSVKDKDELLKAVLKKLGMLDENDMVK